MIEVREYLDRNGKSPYREWLGKLDAVTRARIVTSILRVETGNLSQVKGLGGGVSELRLDFGPGYRIYFGREGGELVILLLAGTKKRQQADIEEAHTNWADYKRRKKEE
jgi:putative addiction module killer protein